MNGLATLYVGVFVDTGNLIFNIIDEGVSWR
jgi:hypothetical protein